MAIPQNVANITTGITSLSNLVLISPQTNIGYYQQTSTVPPGVDKKTLNKPGFLFDYEGENVVQLESDITDHYVENNSTISDQISIKPVTVTVQGFVAELNDILPEVNTLVKTAQSKLQVLSPYTPELSVTALVAINEAILAYEVIANTVDSVQQTLSALGVGEYKNKQQLAFSQFFQAYQTRTLFSIQTPWNIFTNMAIKSLRAIQNSETRMITDFEISFKQINFVNSYVEGGTAQERALSQYSDQINLGTNNTNKADLGVSDLSVQMGGTA
jgi:hypothetical protein